MAGADNKANQGDLLQGKAAIAVVNSFRAGQLGSRVELMLVVISKVSGV